ncbi:FadR family transcriptional regulator [Plantibacter sp. VKM Ac-2880]|uniref:FadR/GntR family transcriptional regulator n=1 Tax=Plantibacter sp. VKM Ac-2880 TaxID=2783827 RepID=UPI00188FEECF|nr:FadR/GntR family transcriptional regulator [Plantibacter sp. VKM Ac-2880]MBF4570676.1 FadR family transcriptional regulator [Plantibacter sp. VKM Ac-2880]
MSAAAPAPTTEAASGPAAPAAPASTPPRPEPRAWEVVLARIESDLLSGVLKPGDRLPGERQLAIDLGVGRSSVREAIRVLEVLGLIRTHTGSGPTAGAIIVATPSGGMATLMRLQVAAQGFAVQDVVDTRLVIETAVVHSLATRASERGADLKHPESLLDAMDQPMLTEAEFLALDAQFHLSLAEAEGNQVLVATMSGLRDSIERYVLAGVPQLSSWSATADRLRAEHRGIVEAIRSADPDLARQSVRSHITGYYDALNPAPSREKEEQTHG